MTMTFATGTARYAMLDGDDIYVEGWREPINLTARFTVRQGRGEWQNLDWPRAWALIAPHIRFAPDTEALLRAALPLPA